MSEQQAEFAQGCDAGVGIGAAVILVGHWLGASVTVVGLILVAMSAVALWRGVRARAQKPVR